MTVDREVLVTVVVVVARSWWESVAGRGVQMAVVVAVATGRRWAWQRGECCGGDGGGGEGAGGICGPRRSEWSVKR
eukprot:9493392-Alexandrium_andersonii.AAC.2